MNVSFYVKAFKEAIKKGGCGYASIKALSYILNIILDGIYISKPVLENLIVFTSMPDYSDNARVVYDYLINTGLGNKYKIIWGIDDYNTYNVLKKSGLNCVYRHSVFPRDGMHRFHYYGRRAKYYFHTHGHYFSDGARENQVIINLWHGGMCFKMPKGLSFDKSGKKDLSSYTLTSGNGEITEQVATIFHQCSKESLLHIGLPRNDLLFKWSSILTIDSITEKKILWMPTFRHATSEYISDVTLTSETGLPIIYTPEIVTELNDFLKLKKTHVFIKLHPLQVRDKVMKMDLSHIHLMTNDDLEKMKVQLYEIFNHFDALLTDYSSVSFDYLYLDRPIGYTLDDFEEYGTSRGFPMDNPLDYMPGHHIYTYDNLVRFITDIADGKDEYVSERERVRKEVGMPEGGECCQKLLEFLEII